MRRLESRDDLVLSLASGEATFDRVEALSRMSDAVGLWEELDVAAVRRLAARRRGVAVEDEVRAAEDRFLVLQPSLDESWRKLWGGLDGVSGALVDKALSEAADRLPSLPNGDRGGASWRRATALVTLRARPKRDRDLHRGSTGEGEHGIRRPAPHDVRGRLSHRIGTLSAGWLGVSMVSRAEGFVLCAGGGGFRLLVHTGRLVGIEHGDDPRCRRRRGAGGTDGAA